MKRATWNAAAVAAAIAAIALAAACAGSEPEELTFDVSIGDDAWSVGGENIDVRQGDTVTVNVESDVRGGFHIHGYDLFEVAAPGEPASIEFVADATGRFEIMLHKFTLASDEAGMDMDGGGSDHGDMEMGSGDAAETEVRLGWLRVLPR